MNNPIPIQLQDTNFRFFLIAKDSKKPMEKQWNTSNCFMFFEPKLLNHLLRGGNVGVCTGYGGIIVVDFDSAEYQAQVERLLPKTFTVRTAGKGLKHFYYRLAADEMMRKVGVDDAQGNRLADIQSGNAGIVCPPSHINRRAYSVIDQSPIAEIEYRMLSSIFGLRAFRVYKRRKFAQEAPQPEKVQAAIDGLQRLGMRRVNYRKFQCPFHPMNGSGNLCIFDSGMLHCFHCDRHWIDLEAFVIEWSKENKIQL